MVYGFFFKILDENNAVDAWGRGEEGGGAMRSSKRGRTRGHILGGSASLKEGAAYILRGVVSHRERENRGY